MLYPQGKKTAANRTQLFSTKSLLQICAVAGQEMYGGDGGGAVPEDAPAQVIQAQQPQPPPTDDCRPFVYDGYSTHWAMIDSGSTCNLWPQADKTKPTDPKIRLAGAGRRGNRIPAYGRGRRKLRFGSSVYHVDVVYADVNSPILGCRFLKDNGLVLDMEQETLEDRKSGVTHRTRNFASGQSLADVHSVATLTIQDHSPHHFRRFVERHYPQLLQHDFAADMPKNGVVHRIQTVPHARPCRAKVRPLHGNKAISAKRDWLELERLGIIERCESDWASALHLQPKKDGTWRPCGDYKALNSLTVPDRYPLPNLQSFTTVLQGATCLAKIDLRKAYHLIKIDEQDQHKTAVITQWGLFKFRRLAMGLTNSAQAFQRLIDEALLGLPRVFVYLDDILVASQDSQQHEEDLRAVCDRLEKYGLLVAADKCVYGVPELNFLGYRVTQKGIAPLRDKVKAVERYPRPKNLRQLQAFLGMIAYYRHLLPRAAEVLRPLYDVLVGQPKKFQWSAALDASFAAAKRLLAEYTMLVHPHPTAEVRVKTDASDVAFAAVLEQKNPATGSWQPLRFWSRGLTTTQKAWPPYDKELQAMWLASRQFRPWIDGKRPTFFTDHKAIVGSLTKPEAANTTQRRVKLEQLAQIAGDVRHIAGLENTVADALSRHIKEARDTQEEVFIDDDDVGDGQAQQ